MNYLGALTAGYSVEQILNYLSKNFPELGPRIREAVNAGKSPDEIMKYLGKFDRTQLSRLKSNKKPFEPFPDQGISNPYIQGNRAVKELNPIPESVQQGALAAIPLGATAAVAPKLGQLAKKYGPQALQALERALPKNISQQPQLIKQSGEQILEDPMKIGIDQRQLNTSQPPVSPSITQPTAALQPEVIYNPKEYLEKNGLLDQVKDLLKRGNSPQEAAAALGIKRTGGAKIDPELLENIEEYSKLHPDQELEKPTEKLAETPVQEIIEPEKPSPKIEKKSLVASPQGMGEVREIRGDKALVEVNGKLHKVNADELIQSPIPEKDLADLYDDVIIEIEKQTGKQVSRNVEWAGYDPKTNELAYKPHGSDKLYAYDDISPEDISILTSFLTQRKSTGENFIGAWEAGTESPIGAAMYQLIRKLQAERGGKGQEYKNRYETIYDALEPAKTAAKKKHAERKKKAKKPRPA